MINHTRQVYSISDRETEVLRLIAHECTIQEIASKLYISPLTVVSHRRNLMRKWNVKNMAGLVRVGFECGFLSIKPAHVA